MQGIYLNGRRPKSKKEIRERLAAPDGAVAVELEATSMFGNEYGGPVKGAPDGSYHIVGPDPYTKRSFYGTITKRGDKITLK